MAIYLGSQNVGIGVITKVGDNIKNEDITITENGVYNASESYTGLGTVTVNVDNVKNETLPTITENGTYKPSDGFTGFNEFTVNVESSGGSGDIVTVINKTGDIINEGDKVWLQKDACIDNTGYKIDGNGLSGNIMFRSGLNCCVNGTLYSLDDTKATSIGSISFPASNYVYSNDPNYDIFYGTYQSTTNDRSTSFCVISVENGATTYSNALYTGNLVTLTSKSYWYDNDYDINIIDNYGTILKTYSPTITKKSSVKTSYVTVKHNDGTLILYDLCHGFHYVLGEDTVEETGLSLSTNNTYLTPLGITKDNKYIIVVDPYSLNSLSLGNYGYLRLIKINDDKSLTLLSPTDYPEFLRPYYRSKTASMTFNPHNGSLICSYDNGGIAKGSIECYVYENGNWIQKIIDLSTTFSSISSNTYTKYISGWASISDDFSRLCFRYLDTAYTSWAQGQIYISNCSIYAGLSATKYQPYLFGSNTLTGKVITSANANEAIQVATILPSEVDVTITASEDDVELTME